MDKEHQIHILILGSPRSGTTLLAAMLGCHPKIAILNEDFRCSEFNLLSKPIRGNKLCIPNHIELIHEKYSRLLDAAISYYQRVSNSIRPMLRMRTPVVRGQKARLSIRDYERLAKNLHIIGITRSPKDVIASIQKRGQQSEKTAEYRWRRAVEVLYDLSKKRHPETELTIIHYNRLIGSPERIMMRCLDKLKCDYDESVLSGFMHTPQYKGRTKIDKDKVSGGIVKDLEYPLLKNDDELAKKYFSIVESSL